MKKKVTRRTAAKNIGAFIGGMSMLGPAIAQELLLTPPQVEGPFYPPEPLGEIDVDLTLLEGHEQRASGEVILVRGRVTDAAGNPLAGARVDMWQANDNGRYAHPSDKNTAPLDPNFQGIGITYTDQAGRYGFKTIKPAAYPLSFFGEEGWRARHIHFKVAHEQAKAVTTQMYFEGDPLLAQDLEIRKVSEAEQALLITAATPDADTGIPTHRFDVVLG